MIVVAHGYVGSISIYAFAMDISTMSFFFLSLAMDSTLYYSSVVNSLAVPISGMEAMLAGGGTHFSLLHNFPLVYGGGFHVPKRSSGDGRLWGSSLGDGRLWGGPGLSKSTTVVHQIVLTCHDKVEERCVNLHSK